MASIVITCRIVLPLMVTIGQLRIDWMGRVEILVYDQNRFIRSWIRKRFKEVKNPYQGGYCCYKASAHYWDVQSARYWDMQLARPYQTDELQTHLFLQTMELHHIKGYVISEQGCCQQYGERIKRQSYEGSR
jgi:hypothetical protein